MHTCLHGLLPSDEIFVLMVSTTAGAGAAAARAAAAAAKAAATAFWRPFWMMSRDRRPRYGPSVL